MNIIPEDKENLMEDRLTISLKGRALEKKDLMILDLISSNNWERPIYFNNTSLQGTQLNLNNYVVQEGNAYRLLPVRNPDPQESFVNTEVMYDNMMNNFFFRELDNPNVYYNEDYRNFVVSHRSSFNTLADALIKEGKIEMARNAIFSNLERMPDKAIPYDYETAQTVSLLFRVGEEDRAMEIAELLATRADDSLTYLLAENKNFGFEREKNLSALNQLVQALRTAGKNDEALVYQEKFMEHYSRLNR
jgi:tetratricopeptide (TPR) repeat protein